MAYEIIYDERGKIPNYVINGNTIYHQVTLDQVAVANPNSKRSLRHAMWRLTKLVNKSKKKNQFSL